jgi:CRISPR-associated protein Csh2
MKPSITNSSDFLFVYEAIQCNPNGDPDQENKPRMDYDTKTNLVTDTRVKRFIRDYLKATNEDEVVFVDMEGDSKVSVESKMEAVVKRTMENEQELEKAFEENPNALKVYTDIIAKKKDYTQVWKEIAKKEFSHVNYVLLAYLVKRKFIDIRMFGSAFAVGGFTKAYTGPIQLNWGYSFNKVELMDSSTIVTTMGDKDGNSGFGKDYRVYYSLLGFNGTINAPAAKSTGLSEEDVTVFRKAIWESIPASPTRSKLNQYPKLYLEIIYNEGISNGQFGDLRNLVETEPKEGITDKQVRKFKDLSIDLSALKKLVADDKNGDQKIKQVIVKTSADFDFSL